MRLVDQCKNIFILQTAVSLVPDSWRAHPKIKKYTKKYNRLPLINSTNHQHLIKNILQKDRKDRPDILHFGLLTLLGYSRIHENIDVYFNLGEKLYQIDSDTRLPRDQIRFYGILETLLSEKYKGEKIKEASFSLLSSQNVIFSKKGGMDESILKSTNYIFGGMAFGNIQSINKNDRHISLMSKSLELWTAISIVMNKLFPD